jgi:hypothetical protein
MVKRKGGPKSGISLGYIILIAIVTLLILFFAVQTYSHYKNFRGHQAYLHQPTLGIEPWMTVHGASLRFNVSENLIFKELNVTDAITNQRLTIGDICKKNNLNCTEVLDNLNSLITR